MGFRGGWAVLLPALFLQVQQPAFSQSREQQEWLERFSIEQAILSQQQRAEAESLAAILGIPLREESSQGVIIELQKIVNGIPYYYRTHNLNAAHTMSTSKVWAGGGFGFSLSGIGDTLGIWDANKARQTHQELTGRLIYSDAGTTTHFHATHVAGTMIASGVSAAAKGMSPQAVLRSYNWNDDFSEMATAAAAGMKVSNHSYGYITGWYYNSSNGTWHWYGVPAVNTSTDYKFGYYSAEAQSIDSLAINAPHYLIVKSAGNDRNYGPSSQPVTHSHSGSGSFTCVHDINGAPSGYDCISGFGLSKNVLTVGAVDDIPGGYTTPASVVMSSFSSWGPADDGRIKPDIVANGVGVYSATNTSNAAYATYSGTSMASPNASGSIGLLLQLRRNIAGNIPYKASTLKGLVIHTADEAGPNPGPDYMFGWGLMNTLKAAQVMRSDSIAGLDKNIRELVLSQGQTIDVQVTSDGSQPLRATICWTDPAGTPPAPALDPPDIMLVNDLDLRIIRDMTTYSPWVLNPASPASAATTGDNIRDNVEQVHIASPAAGTYTVRITHKGTLSGGPQAVSLVVTGVAFEPSATVTSPNGGENWAIGGYQTISWTSSGIVGNVKIELSTNGGSSFSTLFDSTANDGAEGWTVTGPVTASARIRVSSVDNPTIADTSDANFAIVQPTITVTSPDGGETWPIGGAHNIQWVSTNLTGNVRVELSRDNGVTYPETLFANTPNDGIQSWSVTGPPTATARVRIVSIAVPSVSDESNSAFSVVQPSLTIISPDGGEVWATGSSQTVQWSSAHLTGNVKIELSRDGGGTYPEMLFANTTNDGSESWTVTGPATTGARIRVTSLVFPSVVDASNDTFAIVQPSITVTSPDGGETWVAGTPESLAWTSAHLTGTVTILLSRNGGVTYPETLFSNIADDGLELWNVAGPVTSQARVRVVSDDLPPVSDASDADFSIAAAGITVLMPNGDETWLLDSVVTIGWNSAHVSGDVMIELSRDGGAMYDTLFAATADDGTENWTVTSPTTASALVRISSVNVPSVMDVSNAPFTILAVAHFPVAEGWNMLSLPVTTSDPRRSAVFPSAVSPAFGFDASDGYSASDTVHYGLGYWLKFPASEELTITGMERIQDTIEVSAGWNLIGSITYDVAVDSIVQIPAGIVETSYYGYDPPYSVKSFLEPAKAYWVKVNQNGKLVISKSPSPTPSRPERGSTK